jgi:hypothetical protein
MRRLGQRITQMARAGSSKLKAQSSKEIPSEAPKPNDAAEWSGIGASRAVEFFLSFEPSTIAILRAG